MNEVFAFVFRRFFLCSIECRKHKRTSGQIRCKWFSATGWVFRVCGEFSPSDSLKRDMSAAEVDCGKELILTCDSEVSAEKYQQTLKHSYWACAQTTSWCILGYRAAFSMKQREQRLTLNWPWNSRQTVQEAFSSYFTSWLLFWKELCYYGFSERFLTFNKFEVINEKSVNINRLLVNTLTKTLWSSQKLWKSEIIKVLSGSEKIQEEEKEEEK